MFITIHLYSKYPKPFIAQSQWSHRIPSPSLSSCFSPDYFPSSEAIPQEHYCRGFLEYLTFLHFEHCLVTYFWLCFFDVHVGRCCPCGRWLLDSARFELHQPWIDLWCSDLSPPLFRLLQYHFIAASYSLWKIASKRILSFLH